LNLPFQVAGSHSSILISESALGLSVGLLAVVCACTGNALTLTLSRRGLPLVPMLGWCMGYGALVLLVVAAWQGSASQIGHESADAAGD
jgi:hypothetical protein